jgi:hypothetical protein
MKISVNQALEVGKFKVPGEKNNIKRAKLGISLQNGQKRTSNV